MQNKHKRQKWNLAMDGSGCWSHLVLESRVGGVRKGNVIITPPVVNPDQQNKSWFSAQSSSYLKCTSLISFLIVLIKFFVISFLLLYLLKILHTVNLKWRLLYDDYIYNFTRKKVQVTDFIKEMKNWLKLQRENRRWFIRLIPSISSSSALFHLNSGCFSSSFFERQKSHLCTYYTFLKSSNEV